MTKLDAEQLAATIRQQFPHVNTLVLQSTDNRNSPRNWFIAIRRSSDLTGPSLLIHSPYEWQEAKLALEVLGA